MPTSLRRYPDAIVGEQLLVLIHFGQEHVAKIAHILLEAIVGLVEQPADAEGVGGETRAAVFFEDFEGLLAFAEAIEHRRDGADIERVRTQPEQVAGDAVQLGEDDAHGLGARRGFHIEQLLHRQAVAQPVGDGGHVIHAVHVGVELRIRAVFGDLLHAAVQVADDAIRPQDFFAIQLEDDSQHSVRGGVLRSHVEDQFGGI
jgi:hypothetical protein